MIDKGQFALHGLFTMLSMLEINDDVIKWKHFRVTGLLREEFTGHRWIPLTKASDAQLWCFLWSGPAPTVEQTMEAPVIWDVMALIMTPLLCNEPWREFPENIGRNVDLELNLHITLTNYLKRSINSLWNSDPIDLILRLYDLCYRACGLLIQHTL